MKKILGLMLVAGACVLPPLANAAIYTYTGATLSNGGQVSGTADVTYAGAGSYVLGSGLNSFTLNGYDASNVLQATTSVPTDNSIGYVNYLTFDGSGAVTNWFLLGYVDATADAVYTLGNDFASPSNCGCGTQDYWQINNGQNGSELGQSLGSWSVQNAVPEPASLGLMGLALVGLAVSRRNQKKSA